jgi:hypothetical protein
MPPNNGHVHYVTCSLPQPRKETKMAKKPPMPKSGKAKPKGGKCK